jgi:VanZ family protein
MALLAAFCFTVLYGVTDEIHQLWVPGRSSDLLDALADATGALLFIFMFHLMQRIRSRSGRAGVDASAN